MSISNISEDIIVLISDYVVAMNEDTLEGWKDSLMLLSINNAWRVALLPIIYRRLYSVYHETNTQKTKSDGKHENTLISHSLKTNLNLVAESGYANFSKRFSIDINDKNPTNGLKSIIAKMEKYACNWKHIKSIHAWIKCSYRQDLEDPSNIKALNLKAGNVVDALFKLMPRIVKLNLSQAAENCDTKIIFEKLAEAYSGQATRLVCNRPLLISRTCYFSGLAYLKIKMDSRLSHQIPIVCAESLQYLSIDNLPINSMWPAINENDKIRRVEFLNLHSLHISFIGHRQSALEDEGHTQSKTTSMIFPKLSCLSVQNIDGFYSLINRAVFPKRISKLRLTGKLEDYGLLNKKMLPTVARLLLTIISVDGNSNGMFDAINNLAWKGQERTALEILATGGVEFDISKELTDKCKHNA
ncbi:hypothetical protein COEREDRAFT_84143 [Coemansia reversa NRRL 1564]|uniref:F-box domain-containing protein n=1 Tax=Coemansia reversa (strain ATCC 12441 / NRRL 1564) TaxID=763665 RepID=A0A2G5BKH8_COERN|nr:hypothetical protein COEREDRAFT_84143 [Coemansia reversa NRRL 1564]|eukprot:PIA19501.1 hypothetical protein COEREDRAFT_84143 [Coemansia reversa NRRL 1564]